MSESNYIEFDGITYIPKPETMYVLIVTWRRVVAPVLIPATIEACEYEAKAIFDVAPAGVSTSAKKLKERADELRERFDATFEGYQILEVGVIE